MPKVSIVIPVYNVAEHIRQCLQSALHQTLSDIEVICVNDASTDDSLKIINEFAERDARVRIINLATNLTANQARKDGVLASTGETIMFVDGDDMLRPTACEVAHRAITQHGADVIHFGARVINRSGVPETRIKWNQDKIAPCLDRIEGDLIWACFHEKRFFFTLWNKIFRGDLARAAFQEIEDGKFPRAQDLYAVFLLLHNARIYQGISDELLDYNFGTGITGNLVYELPRFERFCQASRVASALLNFTKQKNTLPKYGEIVSKIRHDLLNDSLGQWIDHLNPSDMSAGFDLLCENWGITELVAALAAKSVSDPGRFNAAKLARILGKTVALKGGDKGPCQTIGVFYHRFHSGGVQRVISLLIPKFLDWGIKVILITEEKQEEGEYPLPSSVVRAVIPTFDPKHANRRAEALVQLIREHSIDTFNSHASSSPGILFDMILAKSLGCRVVLSRHEIAFASFLNGTDLPARQPDIFALSDTMTVLTRMDEQYYRIMGVPAVYLPNPKPALAVHPVRAHEAPPTVIWVGRMDYFQKQCQEPIEIMKEVVQQVPNAKLLMVGGGWTPDAEKSLRKRIQTLQLETNVELCGYTPNPETYYSDGACHLMTSSWENYPMVIEESRAYGLPLVLYKLPYLELLKSGRGFMAVDQLDRRAAASAIVKLLQNPTLREKMGKEGQSELLASDDTQLETEWKDILFSNTRLALEECRPELKPLSHLFQSMLELYVRGIDRRSKELAAAKKRTPDADTSRRSDPSTPPPLHGTTSALGRPTSSRRPTMAELASRKQAVGSLGAIDFLISRQKAVNSPAN